MDRKSIEFRQGAALAEGIPDCIDDYVEHVLDRAQDIGKRVNELMAQYGMRRDQAMVVIDYFDDLNLSPEELENKMTLDVGSDMGKLKEAMSKMGIASKLFVNFDQKKIPKNLDIRGRAEFLPFKDESFDFVLAHASVPIMQATKGQSDLIIPTLQELFRVARVGGKIRVSPVGTSADKHQDMAEKYEKLKTEVFKGLQQIKDEHPDAAMIITKIFDKPNSSRWRYALEIIK